MRADIHPKWYPEAQVRCACGNTWNTGATQPEIRTDVCSACHPFYTGEQRIVDTEGQVDRFLKRLRAREEIRKEEETRSQVVDASSVSVETLELGTRYENALAEAGIENVGQILARLQEGGDDAMLAVKGFGAKTLIDVKKKLRAAGYEVPES